jgi:hypothetical protein
MPIASSIWCAARSRAPALAAQPLAVEQVGAGELGVDTGTAEERDRVAVVPVSVVAIAEQSADPGLNSQRPVGGPGPGAFGKPFQRGLDQCRVTGAGGRLGQLGHDERPIAQGVAFERPPGGIACGLVAVQAVAEN